MEISIKHLELISASLQLSYDLLKANIDEPIVNVLRSTTSRLELCTQDELSKLRQDVDARLKLIKESLDI